MTNNPADAMRAPFGYLIEKAGINNGYYFVSLSEYEHVEERFRHIYKPIYDAPPSAAEDTARLDWLDQVNTRTNDRVGTSYGWKFDINHNRAALTDHNLPALHVRAAIDAGRAHGRGSK